MDSNKSIVEEPTTTTTAKAMNKKQTSLEIYKAIATMLDSNWSDFSAPSYMKWIWCLLYNDWPAMTPLYTCLFVRLRYGLFLCAYIYIYMHTFVFIYLPHNYNNYKEMPKCRKKWRGGLKKTIELMLIRPPQLQLFKDGIKINATDTK